MYAFIDSNKYFKLPHITHENVLWSEVLYSLLLLPYWILSVVDHDPTFINSVKFYSKLKISINSDWMDKRLTKNNHTRFTAFIQNYPLIFAL